MFAADGPEKVTMIDNIFEKVIPAYLKFVEEVCGKGNKFLCGEKLTIADFWVGGVYTNFINNPAVGFAQDRWAASINDFPNFKAYGERYTEENSKWLGSRPTCPA